MKIDEMLIHPKTEQEIEAFLQAPKHALLLEGMAGNGKKILADTVAARLLGVDPDSLSDHAYYKSVSPKDGSIQIDQIRSLMPFVSLKVPGKKSINRVILIADADLMTLPAQHTLLKLLEEPPVDTVIILTSSYSDKLIATIKSRLQRVIVRHPDDQVLRSFLAAIGHSDESIRLAIAISGGSTGGALEYLENGDGSESDITVSKVKEILSGTLFDQLVMIESNLKDKSTAKQFVSMLALLSKTSLMQAKNATIAKQWSKMSEAAYVAEKALNGNGNAKLVLLDLMLSLR